MKVRGTRAWSAVWWPWLLGTAKAQNTDGEIVGFKVK